MASQSHCRRIRRDSRSEGHCDIVTSMIYLFTQMSINVLPSLHCKVPKSMLYFGHLAVRHSYRYPVHPCIRAASAKAFLHSKPQYLPKYLFIPTNFKMKTIFPIAFALFGAALAAPVRFLFTVNSQTCVLHILARS